MLRAARCAACLAPHVLSNGAALLASTLEHVAIDSLLCREVVGNAGACLAVTSVRRVRVANVECHQVYADNSGACALLQANVGTYRQRDLEKAAQLHEHNASFPFVAPVNDGTGSAHPRTCVFVCVYVCLCVFVCVCVCVCMCVCVCVLERIRADVCARTYLRLWVWQSVTDVSGIICNATRAQHYGGCVHFPQYVSRARLAHVRCHDTSATYGACVTAVRRFYCGVMQCAAGRCRE